MSKVRDFLPPGDYSVVSMLPYDLVALLALGMALSFISADRQSLTSRYLALTFVFIALSIDLSIVVGVQFNINTQLHGIFGLADAFAAISLLQWILLVRRTVPAGKLNVRGGDRLLRLGQLSAAVYGALSVCFPEVRLRDFLGAANHGDAFNATGFTMFALPIFLAGLSGSGSIVLLLNRNPDAPEKARVVAMAWAIPFLLSSLVMPLAFNAVPMILGQIVFLLGATRYHTLQGERAGFMAGFMSPQVTQLVAERGLASAMKESTLELSVVSCDLRGFTAYAESQSSERVIQVLREYYESVGQVVAEFGATIKDFAGDGILILVGAPIPVAQHAQRAVELAQRIRSTGVELTRRWSTDQRHLGIGVAVSSGPATVGIINSSVRMEYTAVGSTVNLACRLCEQAAHGEILIAQRTRELLGEAAPALHAREPMEFKGFTRRLESYALA